MDKVDWNDAPEWADRLMKSKDGDYLWCNVVNYRSAVCRPPYTESFSVGGVTLGDFKLIEMRPNKWKEGEKRMELIVQNGNDGEHYVELDNVNHPSHYQSDDGIECIDAIRAALGKEGFISHCRGTAIKYAWRSGKKAAHAEDLRKAAWYLERAAIELEQEKGE